MTFTMKTPQIGRVSIGRLRVTKAVSPGEPGYIRSMRIQTDQLAKILNEEIKHIKGVTATAMAYALKPIMEFSQKIVPVDTSKLKDSGFIEVRQTTSGAVAVVGYARHGQPHYAAFVHEMIHIPHQKGKSAKFLEIAVHTQLGLFKRRLINYITTNSGIGK